MHITGKYPALKPMLLALAAVMILGCWRVPDQLKRINIQDLAGSKPQICSVCPDLDDEIPAQLEKLSGWIQVEAEEIRLTGRIENLTKSVRAWRFTRYAYLIIAQFFISILALHIWLVCRSYQEYCRFSAGLIYFIHDQDGKK